ncbi:ABC transporter permease [Halocatena salina]|uniref:ABC transporter permease n=1 Tax=Halocatena salina TaxID=2934340 RepID=A0A8U0A314_9EURY|nr:ABC transporter permease [Halocatena salina]UPM42377.1 ABC transporter permease [Halocatena salina]
MSTHTHTNRRQRGIRGLLARLRDSQFLSELASNRLAIVGLLIIATITGLAIYARVFIGGLPPLTDGQYQAITLSNLSGNSGMAKAPPSLRYPFGLDGQARSIFPRVMYGAWLALKWGTITVGASTILGVGLGILAAYYGNIVDNVIMRTMDILLAFPSLLLALALVAIFGTGLENAVIALVLVYTPRFSRVVRGAALKVMEDEYIDATVALGAKDFRVLVRHVVPNCLAPVTVQSTLNFGLAIIDLAALSFLGFGAEAGTPSWGWMLSNGVDHGLHSAWWWAFFPGLFLALTVLGFNLLGDGMRDALDPRMRDAID